jgi:hypothetical protein
MDEISRALDDNQKSMDPCLLFDLMGLAESVQKRKIHRVEGLDKDL